MFETSLQVPSPSRDTINKWVSTVIRNDECASLPEEVTLEIKCYATQLYESCRHQFGRATVSREKKNAGYSNDSCILQ